MNEVAKRKILIVDDDPGDILWLKKIINSHFVTIEAQDGLSAVEMAVTEKPDLIIMDVMMPKISGYTACAKIKERSDTKDIPIILVTGLGEEINKNIGKEMGADGYLVKPVTSDQLLNSISKLLEW